MVLADPVHGCEALRNEIFAPSVILMERGECSFTVKALNGEKAGATVIMVTDSQNYGTLLDYKTINTTLMNFRIQLSSVLRQYDT